MKKLLMPLLLSSSLLLLGGCSSSKENTVESITNSTEVTIDSSNTEESVDFSKMSFPQLSEDVQANEYLVQMNTSEGAIKIRLFPEVVPKTVENFVTHAKKGYYDGVTFHRVINNFMIQGGDPEGTGAGGESIWGEPFEDESNRELFNIRGALSMANAGPDTNGSQFFIVQNSDNMSDGLLTDEYPQQIIDKYKSGGTPYLDYTFEGSTSNHTVFGQVTEGMDVVDKIASVKTGANDKPEKDVVIKSIDILQEPK
ncbi:peptidylprolyl isomerase [Vagococcus xieshaowenii]|uniref:Peptidyl-prolyl cis-trans isomerase n=1 Tax=Vagococcus xieshaowenii TaxID=2562451 RepID=A0AAJ5EEL6_9ENTE|nr:peptidylprolyl isomerase [Vagococcus xieshaowenii]QCA28674.1 peptidylprolyl isomerase [Vagococcus xieshaowenii]TFZ40518.1 peptidylprolyl isomerase [Vagococcus xieshaowenii]